MTLLLISGSRAATPNMLDYARRAVARAYALGWTIIVGDAVGVDQAVAEAATALHHQHPHVQQDAQNAHLWTLCRVFGLSAEPRNGVQGIGIRYTRLERVVHYTPHITQRGHVRQAARAETIQTYAQRDRYMVSIADKVLCVWDGRSAGTEAVYRAAKERGIEAWLVQP